MLKKLAVKYIQRTHHWRDVGHDQLGGLYVTFAIRTIGISMISVFLPFYLYELGASIQEIIVFYMVFCAVRIPFNFFAGYVVGRIGPKHTIALSTLFKVIEFCVLLSLGSFNWPLWFVASLFSFANALFFTAYHTDFSKIKTTEHAGKEVGHMIVVQKIGAMLGPLVGGLIAGFGDVRISIGIAAGLMASSLIPLFMTSEPVKTHQHITYKGLYKKLLATEKIRNVIALGAYNTSIIFGGILWTLYISLTIFSENTYASIGLVTTGSILLSIFTTKLFGRIADRGGRKLLRIASLSGAGLAVSRLFIQTPAGAVAHNVTEAQLSSARGIPFAKGYYAESDEFPGQRIAYIVVTESYLSLFRLTVLAAFLVFLQIGDDQIEILKYGAAGIGALGVLISLERFRALR